MIYFSPGFNLINHPNAPQVTKWASQISQAKITKWPAYFRSTNDGITRTNQWAYYTYFEIITGNYPSNWGFSPENVAYDFKSIFRGVGWILPWHDELPIQDLWRHHINRDYVTKVYLPIGVFLETFSQEYDVCSGCLNDPTYEPTRPYSQNGMWPMCPHRSDTVATGGGTSTTDAGKSFMVQLAAYGGGGYQGSRDVGSVASQYCPASTTGIKECSISGFRSYRVGMIPGFTMNPATGCARGQTNMLVQRNIYKCIACTGFQRTYCQGMHECLYYVHPTDGFNGRFINPTFKARIEKGDKSYRKQFTWYGPNSVRNTFRAGEFLSTFIWFYPLLFGFVLFFIQLFVPHVIPRLHAGMSSEMAIDAAITALSNEINEHLSGDPYIYESVPTMPLYQADKALWKNGAFTTYNAGVNSAYEADQPATINNQKCEGLTEANIESKNCEFADNYYSYISSVKNNMMIQEGLVVKPRTRMAYWTNKQHMLSHGIPSWSSAGRPADQVFLGSLLDNTTQCSYASKWISVCSTDTQGTDDYWYLNPWLGGAFNVLERNPTGTSFSPLSAIFLIGCGVFEKSYQTYTSPFLQVLVVVVILPFWMTKPPLLP